MMKKIATICLLLFCKISFSQTQKTTQTTSKKPATVATTKTNSKPKATTTTTKPKSTTVTVTPKTTNKPATQTTPATQAMPQPKQNNVTVIVDAKPNQTNTSSTTQTTYTSTSKPSEIESVWIGGSIGGGAVVSSNVINSGALFPMNLELLFQKHHHRCGIGFANEIYVTPEALGRLVLGEGLGVKKLYFSYEAFIFRNFPINLGFSTHIGFFGTSKSSSNNAQVKNSSDTTNTRGGLFGNVGLVLELGARPCYFFVRPAIEYKSWSGFHKEIIGSVSIGLRFKYLTDYEIKRRADKKRDRENKY